MKKTNAKDSIKYLFRATFGETSSNYGHGRILREYASYPRFLPLNAQIQHGWYHGGIYDLRKAERIPFLLVWSERIAEMWASSSAKKAIVLGAPFVHYRKMRGIVQDLDATGTVVFPEHSTPSRETSYDVDQYCADLRSLPEKYHPITICLHFRDLDKYKEVFEAHGFPVVSAGNSRQAKDGFVKSYYAILKRHAYACSNEIGSYTFYSVELGLPFFMMGPLAVVRDKADPSRVVVQHEYRQFVRTLFSERLDKPSEAQKAYVEGELGVRSRIEAPRLRSFLLRRFFLFELPFYPWRFARALWTLLLVHLGLRNAEEIAA